MKKCSRCGNEFTCGPADGKAGCWCEDIANILPFTGEDCMCPGCAQLEVKRLENTRQDEKTLKPGHAAAMWIGLCSACRHAKRLTTKGDSIIYLCGLSTSDPQFVKYPRLPVFECVGYASAML